MATITEVIAKAANAHSMILIYSLSSVDMNAIIMQAIKLPAMTEATERI